MTFTIKANAVVPPLAAILNVGTGGPQDLTGATVKFTMTNTQTGAVAVSLATVTVVGAPTNGQVQYNWQAGDTATPGAYKGEFKVIFGSGAVGYWPSDDYVRIVIEAPLA